MTESLKKSLNSKEPIWHLKPSPVLLALFVGLHGLGLFSVLLLPLDGYIIIALCLLLIGLFVYQVKEHVVLNSQKAIVALSLQESQWHLITKSAEMLKAKLLSDSYLGVGLVLNFQTDQGRKTIIVPKDRLSASDFHSLCLHLQKEHS